MTVMAEYCIITTLHMWSGDVEMGSGMKKKFNDRRPIYLQIAEAIEDDILTGKLQEGEQCYSQLQLAKELDINPATAAKGIRVLVDRGILNKVRGQAMTVKKNASEKIRKRKMEQGIDEKLQELVQEARKLGVSKDILVVKMVQMYHKLQSEE